MSAESHLAELKRKHAAISARIEEMQRQPSTQDQELSALKKDKLRLKEEIARMGAL